MTLAKAQRWMRDGINHAYVQTRLIASVRTGACRASVRKWSNKTACRRPNVTGDICRLITKAASDGVAAMYGNDIGTAIVVRTDAINRVCTYGSLLRVFVPP